MTPIQIKALDKFKANLLEFLNGPSRNLYVTSGRSISVYTRKGVHLVNNKKTMTLDIGSICIGRGRKGQGLGMATVNLMHEMNPFEATYIESILNNRFKDRLIKEGWLIVPDSCPTSVYKEK